MKRVFFGFCRFFFPLVILCAFCAVPFSILAPMLYFNTSHCDCHYWNSVSDCLEKGQYQEALEHADILIEGVGRDDGHAYGLRAQAHARLGDIDAAIRDLTTAIDPAASREGRSPPVSSVGSIRRGRCYEQKGMTEEAAAEYRKLYHHILARYRNHNAANLNDPMNYMEIVQEFWTGRQTTDRDFGFDMLQFDQSGSYRETKRLRLNAVLDWMRQHIDVHPTIIGNIDDVDAKIYWLEDTEAER